MIDPNDLLFYDDLTESQRLALQERLQTDPDLAAALHRWQAVRDELRRRLDEHVPDRDLLVLYALDDEVGSILSVEEQRRLDAARADLEAALAAHPSLRDVVDRIHEERDDFEETWARHFGNEEPSTRRAPAERRAASRPARSRPMRRWASRAAAALAVIAFVGIVTLMLQRDGAMVAVEAPEDATRIVELADGSTVRLYDGARLSYPEAAEAGRRTELRGRAYFDVTASEQPFIVETATAQATVLGTSFGVQAGDDATEVVLATGRLSLAARGDRERFVVLEPGEMSRVAEAAAPTAPVDVDLDEALAWTDLFLFTQTPVDVIAERLSTHYDVAVSVAPSLSGERVTGTFDRDRNLTDVLGVIAAALDAEVAPADGGYLLRPGD